MNMQLARRDESGQLVSLVPMIDVLLILLVFFMVTSTYLNLDMIPVVERGEDAPSTAQSAGPGDSQTLLIRIGANGAAYVRGQAQTSAQLSTLVEERLATGPALTIVVFPSTRASMQHLVSTMDLLTTAGATRVRLMQLEDAQ